MIKCDWNFDLKHPVFFDDSVLECPSYVYRKLEIHKHRYIAS